ncbi:MAG: Gfo/Idh/MocA family protein [Solirubrobacteraceae bacterium]
MSSGQPSIQASTSPVGWGILSTARINTKLLAGLRVAAGAAPVAVASREQRRADVFAREHGIPRAHGDYESLLADPDVEAVYISLPNSLHIPWTVRALEAGKHVLCEKPLSRHSAEVEGVFDVAEREDRLLMEAFMYRHHPQATRLQELVAEGALGRLRAVRGAFSFFALDPSDVRFSPELDGGSLMDVGCYCVNAARMLAGEPERVSAQQVTGGGGVDVTLVATLAFGGEVLAHFDCGLVLAERDELEVVGEEGSLFLDDPWHCRSPVIEVRRAERTERLELPSVNPYCLEVENFSAAVRGTAQPLLGRADAVGQARTIEALYAAADTQSPVALGG